MSSEESLSCPICHEVFKNPVVLSCSHSFCKVCLRNWWREKPKQDCPVCKRRSSRSDPPLNLVLRNLCEDYVQQREQKVPEEQVCQVHSESLKLFCLTDQQPVCVVCRDSKVHEDHRFRPIAEAAQDLRDELNKSLLPLKENLQEANKLQEKFAEKADHIKKQFNQREKQIQAEFKKLHQFLVEEEEQKTQRMNDKIAAVSREIEALSESIRATEEQLRAPDVSFLLKYKAAVERVQHCPLLEEEPPLDPGDLIDQAKHQGNLTFNIWTNMKRLMRHHPFYFLLLCCIIFIPSFILDPNIIMNTIMSHDFTSFSFDDKTDLQEEEPQLNPGVPVDQVKHLGNLEHQPPFTLDPHKVLNLVLSDDLTSFTLDDTDTDQESPEKRFGLVFGSEGFDSGSHCWDMEVGDNEMWGLGVMSDLFLYAPKDNLEICGIEFSDGKYKAVRNNEAKISLKVISNLQKIKVCLDCDKHELSFYDLDTNAHIHTFTQISHKKLFPVFVNGGKSPIRILPQKYDSSSPFDAARN